MLKYTPRPHSGCDSVSTVNPNDSAFEILWRTDACQDVMDNSAVVEHAGRKNRYCCKCLAVRLGGDVRRECELTDVEFEASHHPAERLNQYRHVYVFHF